MRTLRVKLTVPETSAYPAAREAFDAISEVHADQAIFQVNQTQYIGDDGWGFKITYRSNQEFVRTAALPVIEQAMAQVATDSFERRLREADVKE